MAQLTALVLLGLLMAAAGVWTVLAALNLGALGDGVRLLLAGALAVLTLAALLALAWPRWRWTAVAAQLLVFGAVIAWFFAQRPSNDRPWQADVAQLPWAQVDGELVTVHNVRNFVYRSETDYTPAWEQRRYDLRQLVGVDLVAVYWMGPAIAHTFLSFSFAGGEQLAVSIETRKEVGEAYSTVKGFFRQYELYYVVADERDVIGLRTNHRHNPPEDVYIYRLKGAPEGVRSLFLEYVKQMNSLKSMPQFYNTLTSNCTTDIWVNAGATANRVPLSWKVLASGFVPEYLHENGRLVDGGLPLAELQRRAHANARAQAAGDAADFSLRIRAAQPDSRIKP